MHARIGIDFGGVTVKLGSRSPGGTVLHDHDGAEIAQEGVFEAVRVLVAYTEGSVWIVSKAGPMMQHRTRLWLDAVEFFPRTGIHPEHVQFCRERAEKADICRTLGITHFVDDRMHVMQLLRPLVPNLYIFGVEERRKHCPPVGYLYDELARACWVYLPGGSKELRRGKRCFQSTRGHSYRRFPPGCWIREAGGTCCHQGDPNFVPLAPVKSRFSILRIGSDLPS